MSAETQITRNGQEITGNTSVAVIVFSYNYEIYLRQEIDSLLNQSKPFDQILVVDDGSTDGSREIINSYGDKIQAVFKENSGQLGAAVYALPLVRTRFVYFLDADDFADPDAATIIREHLAGNPVKVQFQLRCVDNDRPLDSVIPAYPRGYTTQDMIIDNEVMGFYTSPPTSGNVFSVKTLRSLPLDQLMANEAFDGSPMLSMPYLGEVRSVTQIIANYRIHGANFSLQHAPSVALYERSLRRHKLRWEELRLLAPHAVHPQPGTTVIELEAQCLKQGLSGKRVPFSLSRRYVSRLADSALPLRMKILLSLFIASLSVLPASIGKKIILARRLPSERNPVFQKALRVVLGVSDTQRI
ncbi:MAG: glycosyltransferase family 2 protein [Burkholderiaceae bacterium]